MSFRPWKENIDTQYQQALARAEQSGFNTFVGSEKQVKWATSLRDRVFLRLISFVPADISRELVAPAIVAVLNLERRASWWIEQRMYGSEAIYTALVCNHEIKFKAIQAKYTQQGATV